MKAFIFDAEKVDQHQHFNRASIFAIGAILTVALLFVMSSGGEADALGGSLGRVFSTSVVCPSSTNYSPDGGAGKASGKVECPQGYTSIRVQNKSATVVYMGACPNGIGGQGCMNPTNASTVGLDIARASTYADSFSADVTQNNLRCTNANTSDAGVTLAVMCGR